MPNVTKLAKAYLQEIAWDDQGDVTTEGRIVTVQFNPETLKVAFSNQVSGDDSKGGAAIQYSSRGTTKLALDLVFDVSAPDPDQSEKNDVRRQTVEISQFMSAEEEQDGEETKYIPPGVRFQWGSFLFEGVMESMSETLEYFSVDGVPLRASVSISLVRQDVEVKFPETNAPAAGVDGAGTQPLAQAGQGDTAQGIAASNGFGENWQGMALANGIEDPLNIDVGTFINTRNVRVV